MKMMNFADVGSDPVKVLTANCNRNANSLV